MIEPDTGHAARALIARSRALRALLLTLIPALLFVGCGGSEPCSGDRCAGGGGASSSDATDFCARWIEAFATYLDRCGCGSEAAARYRAQTAQLCTSEGGLGSLRAAVSEGSLAYHPAAADALFARLEAANAVCAKSPFRSLGLDSQEVYSFAGTFTGTRALGQSCSLPVSYKGGVSDCSNGVCAPDGTGKGVCIAFVGKGEACDASGDQRLHADTARLCHDVRAPDSDGEYESAFDSLTCVAEPGGSKVCATNLPNGSSCSGADSCQDRRCIGGSGAIDGACAARLAVGEACQRSADCLSGACQYDQTPPVCGPQLLSEGAACHYDSAACASGSCNATASGTELCGAPPSAVNSAACTSDSQCLSGYCRGSRCVAELCGIYLD